MHITSRLMIAAAISVLAASGAYAMDRFINQGPGKLVIAGYDTTSYFRVGRPINGAVRHTVRWSGATWRFRTEKQAAAFRSNPKAFAPQFGAYCTGGLSQKHAVYGQPTIWRLYKGKVYLFATRYGSRRFDRNPEGVIRAARAYWETLPIRGR